MFVKPSFADFFTEAVRENGVDISERNFTATITVDETIQSLL